MDKITTWLTEQKIENYTVNADAEYGFVIDVAGDVDLSNRDLKRIPYKFNTVTGSFDCSGNALTSVLNTPNSVGASFICANNKIVSLEDGPQTVGGTYNCSQNKLEDLLDLPKSAEMFVCDKNPYLGQMQSITSLTQIDIMVKRERLGISEHNVVASHLKY